MPGSRRRRRLPRHVRRAIGQGVVAAVAVALAFLLLVMIAGSVSFRTGTECVPGHGMMAAVEPYPHGDGPPIRLVRPALAMC